MKKTEYFVGENAQVYQIANSVSELIKKRDEFLLVNEKAIAKIDSENIQFVPIQNGGTVIAVITLTYYPK